MENDRGSGDGMDPVAQQLAAIAQARATVAERLVTPWWYHPALGLLFFGYVLVVSFSSTFRAVAVVVFVLGCAALARAYRRITGVWISGTRAGRARRWAVANAVLTLAVLVAGLILGNRGALAWLVWCLAAVAFVGIIVFGRRYDEALRADLRSEA